MRICDNARVQSNPHIISNNYKRAIVNTGIYICTPLLIKLPLPTLTLYGFSIKMSFPNRTLLSDTIPIQNAQRHLNLLEKLWLKKVRNTCNFKFEESIFMANYSPFKILTVCSSPSSTENRVLYPRAFNL